ncbi:MAG: Pyridoxamine 5-phosphate oxidase-related protein [Gemmatimonadetes bacterium]|nr:Pyridoxamine 5-phosphate oxidase-related protein [Gemmatimonadota bacterium]
MTQLNPIIRALRGDEAQEFLASHHVGRIAFSLHDRVDIEPLHYVYEAPWIFGRTSAGAKVLTLAHNRWCALEADEVLGMFDWKSVVAKGPFTPLDPASAVDDYDRALTALRRFLPSTLTDDDPTPHRNILFAVHASEISGRCSVSHGESDGSDENDGLATA